MSHFLDQAAIDEVIALGIDLQFDDEIALKIKQREENPPNNFQHDVPSTSGGSSLPNQTATTENNNPENEIEDVISGLPTQKYRRKTWWRRRSFVPDKNECSICTVSYEKGDKITMLPCKHAFHKDCISNWLKENKVCCECQAEVNP
ncbi:PREDICTED: E3 ubiquitin ligase BIG BROTHER-like [Camelina sativa]|uniref:E3 ubiquitin ligase BIG BROTHER-like n=1 Tax=Camelina sativa TaxID=90675 RepID=A0ABM0UQC8_CAMSA|nr:PREDICTED: E3 ubiquitin ligase BIG BROTHER-like [Camelina sativa]